ncbi:MAG: hypothetical protein ACRD2W_16435 [Acidimicrobiales bacterium]
MDDRPRIAFWAHQCAEYALGFLLFLTAIRLVGPPMIHALAGGLLFITLAAITNGPLAALRWIGRATHRALDFGLAALLAASPLLLRFDNLAMVVLAEGMALAVLMLIRRTAYVDPPRSPRRTIDTVTRVATDGARVAGKLVGQSPRRLGRLVGKHKRRPS